MKVVFLDIDGVLNSERFITSADWKVDHAEYISHRWEKMIDPVAVGRLNRLLEATGAKIVVSSSWRIGLTFVELREILGTVGVRGVVLDPTPTRVPNRRGRGDEIQAWLDMDLRAGSPDGPVETFVIMDDADDMLHLTPHLVRTSYEVGLTDADVDRAIELLND